MKTKNMLQALVDGELRPGAFVKAIGIDPASLSACITGSRVPRRPEIVKFAKWAGITQREAIEILTKRVEQRCAEMRAEVNKA